MNFQTKMIGLAAVALMAFATACSDDDDDNGYNETITANTDVTALIAPDFAQKLQEQGIIRNASKIMGSEVLNVTVLNLSGNPLSTNGKLTSLKGIEVFRNLKELDVKSNELTSLDLSKNSELETVRVTNNKLRSLILPARDEDLEILECGQNELSTLDLSGLDDLRRVDCSENNLTSINLTGCTELTTLYANDNKLTSIDISPARTLTAFSCENNPGLNGTFAVTASFAPTSVPANFTTGTWQYEGQTVTVVYSR